MASDLKHKSRELTEGPGRAPARAMLRAVGLRDEDFAKPLIAVANTWSEVTPCNLHLRDLAEKKRLKRVSARPVGSPSNLIASSYLTVSAWARRA